MDDPSLTVNPHPSLPQRGRSVRRMIYSRIINRAAHSLEASSGIKEKAKALRKNPTPSEERLWKYLRNGQINNLNFRRQHPYGIYIIDFFCFKAKLAIEIDGQIHNYRKLYDRERTVFIEDSGVTVLRFKNEDIEKRIDWVITTISKYTETASLSPLGETGKGVEIMKRK